MKKFIALTTLALIATVAYAATERVDRYGGQFPVWFDKGIYINANSPSITANKITKMMSASATVDFTSTSVGRAESSGITVTGAASGDECTVGPNSTAGALAAQYTCYVSAANTVKIVFHPLAENAGTITQVGDAGTATVTSGAKCQCTGDQEGGACAVSSTTLTATGPTNNVVVYRCVAPVDPASGTFWVYVRSAQ